MKAKFEALGKNGTWILVDLPSNVKHIGSKWVHKINHRVDGTIERYNQIEGFDFFDTFSPVAKLTTVIIFRALASVHILHLQHMDVNNAFLQGDLQEDIYLDVPEGVTFTKLNNVCKLYKSLCVLKQSNRKWYEKLTSLLLQEGYHQSSADNSLFILEIENGFTTLLVYVDDFIIARTSMIEIIMIKHILYIDFKVKDLG
jgi:hypothetical protein